MNKIKLGTWNYDESLEKQAEVKKPSSSLSAHKGKVITLVALFALALLGTGGALLYLHLNMIASWSLIGAGGGLALADIVLATVLAIRSRKAEKTRAKDPLEGEFKNLSGTYKIISWNVGTKKDYDNVCSIKDGMKEGKNLVEARKNEFKREATQEEKIERMGFFKETFEAEQPHIICLQETGEWKNNEWSAILPKGYACFTYAGSDNNKYGKASTTVVWNSEKFMKIGHANIEYDLEKYPDVPHTAILLQEKETGTKICVGSAYLQGFALDYDNINNKEEAQKIGEKNKEKGTYQANYDLGTMLLAEAHFYVYAGDCNVAWKRHDESLHAIEKHGFTTDKEDVAATLYDANLTEQDEETPLPVKLDHIFAKGGEGAEITIKGFVPKKSTALDVFEGRPSDHLPIGATITIN